jgi:ribosomal-protein-alanine N-acetyltransferase
MKSAEAILSTGVLAGISSIINDAIESQTFWTALGSIGTVVTLFFIYKQLANTRNAAAYEFLRKEDDRFSSTEMKASRSSLARILRRSFAKLDQSDDGEAVFEELDRGDEADDVLGYFEDLGVILKKGLAPKYLVWTMNCYYVLLYWEVLSNYIYWVRKNREDETYFENVQYLHKKMASFERRMTCKKRIDISGEEKKSFLEDELQVRIRPSSIADINYIMEIERASFPEDAYTNEQFQHMYKENHNWFFAAEILGHIVGYVAGLVSNGIGEFDSIAIDPCYRRLGIGRRLAEYMIKRLHEKGIDEYSLEVRKSNVGGILLYQTLGFEIHEELQNYYGDEDACLMRKTQKGPTHRIVEST